MEGDAPRDADVAHTTGANPIYRVGRRHYYKRTRRSAAARSRPAAEFGLGDTGWFSRERRTARGGFSPRDQRRNGPRTDKRDNIPNADAPPPHREVEFNVSIYFPKEKLYRPLHRVSPVVDALAKTQFDDFVKRVRVFADPNIADELSDMPSFGDLLIDVIAEEK